MKDFYDKGFKVFLSRTNKGLMVDQTREPPLIQASRDRDIGRNKELLSEGANVNIQNKGGSTALLVASVHYNVKQADVHIDEDTKIIETLIDNQCCG